MSRIKTEIILGVTIDNFEIDIPDIIDYDVMTFEDILKEAVWEVLNRKGLTTSTGNITEITLDHVEQINNKL